MISARRLDSEKLSTGNVSKKQFIVSLSCALQVVRRLSYEGRGLKKVGRLKGATQASD